MTIYYAVDEQGDLLARAKSIKACKRSTNDDKPAAIIRCKVSKEPKRSLRLKETTKE